MLTKCHGVTTIPAELRLFSVFQRLTRADLNHAGRTLAMRSRFPDGSNAGMFFDLRIKRALIKKGFSTPAQLDEAYHEMAMMEFERRYEGGRAPLLLTGHGNFMGGIARTMQAVCSRPHVRCTTFSAATEYLNSHPELEGAR